MNYQDQNNYPTYPPQNYQQQQPSYGQPPPNPYQQERQNQHPQQINTQFKSKFGNNQTQGSAAVRFNNSPKYQDLWATILFTLNFIGLIACGYLGTSKLSERWPAFGNPNSSVEVNWPIKDIIFIILGSVVTGFVISFLYLFAIQRFAGKMIKFSFFFSAVVMFGFSALFAFYKSYIPAAIWGFFGLFYIVYFFLCRKRIPFAKVTLKAVAGVIKKYPATIFTGVIGLLLQIAVGLLVMATVFGFLLAENDNINNDNDGKKQLKISPKTTVIITFVSFAFYWTSQVIRNTVHVTVSGLFATYYFFGTAVTGGQVTIPVSNPTASSAKRALTTSFGSVCFGSLIISLFQLLRVLIRSAGENAAEEGNMVAYFCALCANCLLSCIQDMLEYFNHYAYTQVAIYGKSYCEAAKSTWNLVKSRGIDAIINDSIVSTVLGMGTIFVGFLGAGFGCAVIAISTAILNTPTNMIAAGVVGFVICLFEFSIMVEVIQSGVTTTFVCLAEDPRALQRTKPDLFEKVRQTYPRVNLYQ